jgi:cytochrome b561
MNVIAARRIAPALTRYSSTAVAFHWVVAALVVFLGTLGLLFGDIPKESRPFWVNVHGCVGLVYFALVIARLVWRISHKPPDPPLDIGEFDRRISLAAHHLLYGLMVLIPIFGFVAYVWHGRAFDYGFA